MDLLKKIGKKYIIIILLAVLAPILFEILIFSNTKLNINANSLLRIGIEYIIIFLTGMFFILNKYCEKVKKIVDVIFKYRYIIGLIIFAIMVIFKLNTSSIGMWAYVIPSDENQNTTIYGEQRSIRGDEWLVQTPFFLAQSMSDKFYPLENENVRYNGQNMLMVYPAPVFDLTLISKPVNWGFFIFGRDRGLSWYWAMTTVLLVLFAIEFINIITKGDKLLSIVGGLMLAFSPAVMWWYSSNGEIYLNAFAIMVAFYYYMNRTEWSIWKKCLLALGLLSSVTGFVLCFYPALQVPLAYVIVAFCLVEFIKNIKKLKPIDWVIIATTIILIGVVLGYYLFVSYDSIVDMMSTTYPGARNELGGNVSITSLCRYFFGLFTPFSKSLSSSIGNESEVAAFIYPIIGLIIVIISLLKGDIKNKIKNNWFIAALIAIYIFEFVYIYIGFNQIIAKISLFSMSTPNRMMLALGFTGTILAILLLKKLSDKKYKLFSNIQAIVISIGVAAISYLMIKVAGYENYFNEFKLLILLPFVSVMTYLFITFNKKGFSYLMFVTVIVSGLTVNPITYSTDAIYKTNTSEEIQSLVNQDRDSLWIGNRKYEAQYALANGARVLNGINYYPNFEWIKLLDPDGKYDEVYNRYAHIDVKLTDETGFKLLYSDNYELDLSPKDFVTLGIDYYLSNEELEESVMKKYNMNLIFYNEKENERIYRVGV